MIFPVAMVVTDLGIFAERAFLSAFVGWPTFFETN